MSNSEITKWKYTCFTCNRTMNLDWKSRHNKSRPHFRKLLKKQMSINGNDPSKWEFLKDLHISAGIPLNKIPTHIANLDKKDVDEQKEEKKEEKKHGPTYLIHQGPSYVNTISSGVYFYVNKGIKGPEYLYYKQEPVSEVVVNKKAVVKKTYKKTYTTTYDSSMEDEDSHGHADSNCNCNCNKEEGDECNLCIDYEKEDKLPQIDGSSDFKFSTDKFENLSPELLAEDLWDNDITDEQLVNAVIEYELLQE